MKEATGKPKRPGHAAAEPDRKKPRQPRRDTSRFAKGHGKRGGRSGSAGGRTGR
jgi:hypothetical protein